MNITASIHSLDLDDYKEPSGLDKIKSQALHQYEIGRKAVYKALALTYIWYELSKNDKAYLDEAFQPFSNQTNSHKYVKAVKACLRLDVTLQAPTISKYKDVLVYVHGQLSNLDITGADEETINLIVDVIQRAGGLDGCVKAGRAGNSKGDAKPKLTKEEVDTQIKRYRSTKSTLGSIDLPSSVDKPESKMLVMLGRIRNSKVEVIDVAANDNLVRHFVRNK